MEALRVELEATLSDLFTQKLVLSIVRDSSTAQELKQLVLLTLNNF